MRFIASIYAKWLRSVRCENQLSALHGPFLQSRIRSGDVFQSVH